MNNYVEANKAKQVANIGHNGVEYNVDGNGNLGVLNFSQFVPEIYDYFALTYVASGNGIGEIETVTYKTGGAGGTTVATLTITYDAQNRIADVTKS